MGEVFTQSPEQWLSIAIWAGAVTIILAIVLAIVLGFRYLLTGGVKQSDCTERTVGIIQSAKQTNLRVNERPQFIVNVDAIADDGSSFPTTVRKIVSFSEIDSLSRGRVVPIKYNPINTSQAIWDKSPDRVRSQERLALYLSVKHPGDLSYERRLDIEIRGVTKKALLENFGLTGREENGDWEAEATIQITDAHGESSSYTRRLYVTSDELDQLKKGMYLSVRFVPGREKEFIFLLSCSAVIYE